MKKIKGYVFVKTENFEKTIYGKRTSNSVKEDYEDFQKNILTPFDQITEAEKNALNYIQKNKNESSYTLYVGHIEMILAEVEEEFNFFKERENLIVIELNSLEKTCKLFGPGGEQNGNRKLRSESLLYENGLRPFVYINKFSPTPYSKSIELIKKLKKEDNLSLTISTFKIINV